MRNPCQHSRRTFLKQAALSAGLAARPAHASKNTPPKPNLVFLFGDQWRAQATGYAGDPNLAGKTPNLDRLAKQSVNFITAVSCCPVCTPFRASLLTGQYPLTHGLFLNDIPLPQETTTIAEVYKKAGYATGYIGKWHLEGNGRAAYIPAERRHGFDYWKVLECNHRYNKSYYYAENDPGPRLWEGYDAFDQTQDAQRYIREHARAEKPFAIFLSWGPPHNPYDSAPKKYQDLFNEEAIQLRPNVKEPRFKKDLRGYYAHIAALDVCIGNLLETIDNENIAQDTIVVLTSDHGDMLGAHGMNRKQKPWDESIRVPFLLRYPAAHGATGKTIQIPINTPDIMPTLLGLSNLPIPETVEGVNFAPIVRGQAPPEDNPALIMCPAPFGEWRRDGNGREFRGVRTKRYTYVRDLDGPWLLFDNEKDPYQQDNLVNKPAHQALRQKLEASLQTILDKTKDKFLAGPDYVAQWGYQVDESGTVPYRGKGPDLR